jgi:hypothetical protein
MKKTKEEKKIEEIYKEIITFCGARTSLTVEQCEYIKLSLYQAFQVGFIDALQEQLTKPSMKGSK